MAEQILMMDEELAMVSEMSYVEALDPTSLVDVKSHPD
jgi:hypothetical protein